MLEKKTKYIICCYKQENMPKQFGFKLGCYLNLYIEVILFICSLGICSPCASRSGQTRSPRVANDTTRAQIKKVIFVLLILTKRGGRTGRISALGLDLFRAYWSTKFCFIYSPLHLEISC